MRFTLIPKKSVNSHKARKNKSFRNHGIWLVLIGVFPKISREYIRDPSQISRLILSEFRRIN